MDRPEEDAILAMCDEEPRKSEAAMCDYLVNHIPHIRNRIVMTLRNRGFTFNIDDSADDIQQELLTDLCRNAKNGKLMEVASLKQYLYVAAEKCTLNYLRRGGMRSHFSTETEGFWERTDRGLRDEGLHPIELEDMEKALADCIARLPDLQKAYIRLVSDSPDDPITPTEIAELHRVSSESVRNRIHAARGNLKECLERKGYAIPSGVRGGRS